MVSERKIVFDGQVFQSTAWDRGMGKYSLNLLNALNRDEKFNYKEKYIVFAEGTELNKEAKEAIKSACPGVKFVYLKLKLPKIVPGEDIVPIIKHNKKVCSEFTSSISNDGNVDFMILSLLIDQFVAAFPDDCRKMLLFYDLIPLQFSDRYGKMWSYPNYLNRFKVIFEADVIFTISETVSDDIILYTGIDKEKVHSIVGGAIDRSDIKSKKPNIEIPNKYFLMPSGDDLRKNNFRAVEAFEEFRMATGKDSFKLIITSHFHDKTKQQLRAISDAIIFTNNVSEQELKWLYEKAEALLFVSEYEGLGLPILEAAEFDKPIVCSNIRVFNEMSETAFYYVDQKNPSNISTGLEQAVKRSGFEKKRKEYAKILDRYTWSNTAKQAIEILNHKQAPSQSKKPKLAVFTPNPEGYSAIGKVVMLSHASLAEHFNIDYYVENGRSGNSFSRTSFLSSIAEVYDANNFNAKDYTKYDAILYHIGNSEYHINAIKNALHLPGYLIIHDTNLKEAFEDVLVRYAYISQPRVNLENELENLLGAKNVTYLSSLINNSLGVVVHSEYAKEAVKSTLVNNPEIEKLNLPIGVPNRKPRKLRSNRFNLGFAGIIHKAKGLTLVEDIANSADFQDIDIFIFGVPLVEPGVIESLEKLPNVHIQKNLTDFEFETKLSEMDAIVSYRPNYNGETSLTVMEALRHGAVPIVRKIGWFDELPNEAVMKVRDEKDVLTALKALTDDKRLLNSKKRAAKKYAEENHSYLGYAEGLHQLITKKISVHKEGTTSYSISTALKNKKTKREIIKLILNSQT